MATKNNPGAFDCYANAEPDEPMFILLARDKHAPLLVALWGALRKRDGESADKVSEAFECATAMLKWRADRRGPLEMDIDMRTVAALTDNLIDGGGS